MIRPCPSAATVVVGVIGDPVRHSLSPLLHNAAFEALGLDWVSVGFPVAEGRTRGALEGLVALGLAGFSVTMPHKRAAAQLVDELDPVAAELGAVNCCIRRGDRVVGANTDGAGFLASLRRGAGFEVAGRRCLVLGAGGAAAAVVLALARAGASSVAVLARRPDQAAAVAQLAGPAGRVAGGEVAAADEVAAGKVAAAGEVAAGKVAAGKVAAGKVAAGKDAGDAELVVNATPVGMLGAGEAPAEPLLPATLLGAGQVVVDLVYHPRVTPWLAEAARRGATTLGGLGMLVHQAAEQISLWTGRGAPVEAMWAAAEGAPG